MRYFISFFLIFFIFSFIQTINSESRDQESFVEGSSYLFNSIEKHRFFSADFEQSTLQDKQKRYVEGKIIAHRSGLFKISYHEPLNEIIFSDGKDLYRLDVELEQINIQPLEELLTETPIGLFTLSLEKIKELFIIDNCKKNKTNYSCLLTSKNEESFIKWITIGIKNSFFDSFKYLDTFDQTVSLKFKNVSLSNIPLEEFKLIIPEGTDIVRLKGNVK